MTTDLKTNWPVGQASPSWVDGGPASVAIDGNIVNYRDVARAIGLRGDEPLTLILSELISRRGLSGLGQLRGSFAAMIWENERLTLVRDPAGRRPLFYRIDDGGLRVATEPLHLHVAGRGIQHRWLVRRLLLLPERDDITAFGEVRRVMPGEALCFEAPSWPASRTRWAPQFESIIHMSTDEAADRATALLDVAIARIGDGRERLASQLSSGLDSAILLSRLTAHDNLKVDWYTASPGGHLPPDLPVDDEWEAARQHAAALDAVPRRVSGPPSGLSDGAAYFSRSHAPILNYWNLGWMESLVESAADDGHDVMIEGLVGNETLTFAGHGPLAARAAGRHWVQFVWEALKSRGKGTRTALRRDLPAPWRQIRSRAAQDEFVGSLYLNRSSEALQSSMADERRLGKAPESVDSIDDPRARYFEHLFHQDDALYRRYLRGKYGVELHDPFADPDVMDFAFRLAPEAFGASGSRALGFAMIDDRIDPVSVHEGARASQGDHWIVAARSGVALARDILEWAASTDGIADLVDTQRLKREVDSLASGHSGAEFCPDRFRNGALRTLGTLAFARWVEEAA
nr:asparagine synthase-related protein [Sphingomicrobium sp. B8]